jgi:hypothetical protein
MWRFPVRNCSLGVDEIFSDVVQWQWQLVRQTKTWPAKQAGGRRASHKPQQVTAAAVSIAGKFCALSRLRQTESR